MTGYKQVIVLRTDLGLSTGKKISQACHASLGAFKKASSAPKDAWEDAGQKKIVLTVGNEGELVRIFQAAKDAGLPAYLVEDAGKTEIDPGTKTCVGIGPADEQQIDSITGKLEPL
jgi:PTH2 family peptidyl-tRNA hydrolase